MIRFQIKLEQKTFDALLKLSILEHREPRNQAIVLIREALELRGILNFPDYKKRELKPMKRHQSVK